MSELRDPKEVAAAVCFEAERPLLDWGGEAVRFSSGTVDAITELVRKDEQIERLTRERDAAQETVRELIEALEAVSLAEDTGAWGWPIRCVPHEPDCGCAMCRTRAVLAKVKL